MDRQGWRFALGVMVSLKLAAHVVAQIVTPYSFHRDEFLYAAMGDHLRLWHMDFPPFIAVVSNLQRALFGEGLWGLRVLPALAGAALVWLSMDTARRLGARVPAQLVAGGVVLLSPLMLRTAGLFQPVVFDQLFWSLALWSLLRRGLDQDPRWWLGVGLALGFGLLTKFSIAFLAIPLALAVLVTRLRSDLGTRWPWLALGISLIIGHPSLAGQIALGWPFLSQMADLQADQLSQVTRAAFAGEQMMLIGPGLGLAIIGVGWLVTRRGNPTRQAAGLAAAGAFVFLALMRGKPYYAGPIYPVLLGAGAAALTRLGSESASRLRTWTSRVVLSGLAAGQLAFGAVALPMGLPVLAPEPMARYAARLGVTEATTTNRGAVLELPQDYADMLGWEEFADTVIRVWRELDPADQESAVVFASNYGRAGALDWYGRPAGLPPVVSNVGSYWFWGYGGREWDVVIVAGSSMEDLQAFFREVTEVARIKDTWRVPEERDVPVFLARDALESIVDVWPRFEGLN